jgi:hypothetical protein
MKIDMEPHVDSWNTILKVDDPRIIKRVLCWIYANSEAQFLLRQNY